MKFSPHLILIAVAAVALMTACSGKFSAPRADSAAHRANSPSNVVKKVHGEPPVTVLPGTKLRVALLDDVSSDKSRSGDQFFASLTEPVVVEGQTVLAKGTKVRGYVVEAQESGRLHRLASLELKLTEIVRDDGISIGISTRTYTAVAEAAKTHDGAPAGAGTTPTTKGKEIHFAAQHPLAFGLASPIAL